MTKGQSHYKKGRWFANSGAYGLGAAGAKQTDIRFSLENFRQREDKSESDEITGDRQIKEYHRDRLWVEGPFESILFYSEFQTWLLYGIGATAWSASNATTTGAEACSLSASTITKDATTWAVTPTANQWIYVTGSANPGTNGWTKVTSATTNTIVCDKTFTVENAVSLTIVEPPMAVDGTTVSDFAYEREVSDVGSDFTEFRGLVIGGFELRVNREGVGRIAFNIMGATENQDTTTFGDGTPTAAGTEEAFKTGANLDFLYENMASIAGKNFVLNVDNGAHGDYVLGSDGPDSELFNKIRVTGTHETAYESKTLYGKYLAQTDTSFAISLVDPDGNRLLFEVISCELGEGDRTGGGTETDILYNTPFQGKKDASELRSIRITKKDA